jgi:PhzF family phenazine biosynthesis protein
MRSYPFRLVNVFAETIFGGNPLCVFENSDGLGDAEMQALALQFNLSETTFILPSKLANARVRIFTPTFEMPFAGHPTLGTAHVVRDLMQAGDAVSLEMKAGIIPVRANEDVWTLTANAPHYRNATIGRDAIAAMLCLNPDDILSGARWVNTGSDQLIVPLASADAVRRATPVAAQLAKVTNDLGRAMAYVFAPNGPGMLLSRFFFVKHASVIEDPGTGSATANLGAWFLAEQAALPLELAIDQGEAVHRPCRLGLRVDISQRIHVTGRVREIARGTVRLP